MSFRVVNEYSTRTYIHDRNSRKSPVPTLYCMALISIRMIKNTDEGSPSPPKNPESCTYQMLLNGSISLPRNPQPIPIHAKGPTPRKRIASFPKPPSEAILAIRPHTPRELDAAEIRPAGRHADAAAQEAVDDGAEMDVAAQPGGTEGRAGGQDGR